MNELYNGIYLDAKLSSKYKSNMLVIKFITPYSVASASKQSLIARMVEDGSKSIENKAVLEQRLANLYGASLGVSVQRNGNFLEFTLTATLVRPALIKDLAPNLMREWFLLIESLLFEQSFDEANEWVLSRFNREKQLLLTRIKRRKDVKTNLVAQNLLEKIYMNDTSKYLDGLGSEELLKDLTLADLKSEYRKLIEDSLILIAMHGEFDEDILSKTLRKWPLTSRKIDYNYTNNQIITPKGTYEAFIKETDGKQSHLAMAYKFPFIGTLRGRVQMQMLNAIFGGLPNSLLFMEIRENQSLAYSIYSTVDFSRSLLVVFAAVDGESIEHVMNEVDHLLLVMKEKIVNKTFLEEVKFTLISDYIQSRDYQDTELYLQINRYLQPTFPSDVDTYRRYIEDIQEDHLLQLLSQLQPITSFVLKGRELDA